MDQAERLRALVGVGGERRARVIAVTSGKGGVGKTNVAVNLSIALAQRGKKVILADLDIGLANADVILGVQARAHMGHVLSGEVAPLEALTKAPGGVLLLAGASGARHLSDLEKTERDYLTRCLRDMATSADFLVIDTAAGISRNVVQFAAAADEAIVVTTPEPTSFIDGYAVVKALSLEKGSGRIRLVINLANDAAEANRVFERVQTVARRFLGIEISCLGHIVADDQLRQAVRRKRPVLLENPGSPASRGIKEIAERILSEEPVNRSVGFVKRFANAIHGTVS